MKRQYGRTARFLKLLRAVCILLLSAAGCLPVYGQDIAIPVWEGEAAVEINGGMPFLEPGDAGLLPEQYYGELDELGRCTGAYACIGPEMLASEKRETIGGIEPTGWQTIQIGEKREYLYNRCHLIGYQLTGQNANERNLITGTSYMNTSLMKPYEEMVAQYVSGTGNHVLYRVTPLFDGEELLARGVLMEGCSEEDDRIRFCVFCYNVQPGVEIDYATGAASGDDIARELLPAEEGEELRRSSPGGEEEAGNSGSGEVTYVANRNTKKFHYPYCDSVKDMKEKNRVDFEGTREELIDMGYEPCKRCNP